MDIRFNFSALLGTFLGGVAMAASPTGAIASTIYDAEASFAANPDSPTAGQFSLGQDVNGGFVLYPNLNDDVGGTGMDYFQNAANASDPNFIINDTTSPQTIANFTLQPGQIAAGPFQGPTVLQFVAPSDRDLQHLGDFHADSDCKH